MNFYLLFVLDKNLVNTYFPINQRTEFFKDDTYLLLLAKNFLHQNLSGLICEYSMISLK